uniref:NAD-dependent epimerase/dehydratase domain-containing protein n=1 Tax=Florenciella parvula TaxID=236787 RepID=A0A7S2BQW5_9STRA|mmetsp:Transcript_19494/g.40845  ORF Transcript_19494/g.40845 Transcript_19494/m.40845 type:complete len:273 (+) Transcript_19494:668-1486(+)
MIEETPPHPEDPYGISKLAVELDLKAAKEIFDMDFVVFRPHNVYGPKQNIADKFRNAIGIFMNEIMHGEPMTIFGTGNQTRGFSYISDVAPLIAVAPGLPKARNEAFFVGTDQKYSVYDLSVAVAKAMGVPHQVTNLPARNEVVDAYASHDKLRCFFNPNTPVPLEEGLKITAEYGKTIGKFEPTGFTDIEVWEKMPPSWVGALHEWEAEDKTNRARALRRTRPGRPASTTLALVLPLLVLLVALVVVLELSAISKTYATNIAARRRWATAI